MASSGRAGSPGREGPHSGRPDVDLIASLKHGDLAAFAELVARHERSLINFFYHFSWDRQSAEDCAQEVFIKLYAHLDRYEPQARFTTFLYKVARNHWIDRARSGASHAKPVSLDAPSADESERTLRDRVPGPSRTPLELLERREQEAELVRAIDGLPEEQRMVFILSERQGLKYQEIGEILDIPVGTVKSRMHTAVEKLREMLNEPP